MWLLWRPQPPHIRMLGGSPGTWPTLADRHEDWNPSRVRPVRGALHLRQHVPHPLDQAVDARRAVQRVPPLLHGQAEAGRHRRPHRQVRAPVRKAQGEAVARRSVDPERRSALLGAPSRRAWILAEDEPAKVLGRGLAWAWARDVSRLDLVVEDDAGLVARRASQFAEPPAVWWLHGRDLHHVEPEPLSPSARPHPDALALAPMLEAAGADVVVEHGVVAGEILGLEIARVVVGELGARIEVGVERDLVPTAADVRLATEPGARLVLAVPERDDVPATRALAGSLDRPAEV